MNNNDLTTGGPSGDQTSATATIAPTKESLANKSQFSGNTVPPNIEQQQFQQGNFVTNMNQPSAKIGPQSGEQPSTPVTNVTQNQQQQVFIINQQNLASGQANATLPPPPAPSTTTAQNVTLQHQHHQQLQQQLQQQQNLQQHPPIRPLLADDSKSDIAVDIMPNQQSTQESPQKTIITKVKLSDELNIFDWFRTTDIIHQIAEKAKSSVDSVITTLDPGMREYLYSGGNVNIVVISDSQRLVSPIRDSFQDVFGRATVVAARYNPPSMIIDHPIRTACGFSEAAQVAREKIKKLRSDTSGIPQNQVVVVVQSVLVSIPNDDQSTKISSDDTQPEWFLAYCMLIEDPVLGVTMKSFSQLVPMDQDLIDAARSSQYPDGFQGKNLGFTASIDELMASKLRFSLEEMGGDENGCLWLPRWAGLYETHVIRQLGLTLANSYRRKWNECASVETVVS